MIFLDSDVFIIEMRYRRDPRSQMNRQVLDELTRRQLPLAITSHTLLEVIGVLSFNTTPARLATLPVEIPLLFHLQVMPDPANQPIYSGCAVADLVQRMGAKRGLGDAITVEQIHRLAPTASLFLGWNAKHFIGKLTIPVMTPEEWWRQNQPIP